MPEVEVYLYLDITLIWFPNQGRMVRMDESWTDRDTWRHIVSQEKPTGERKRSSLGFNVFLMKRIISSVGTYTPCL